MKSSLLRLVSTGTLLPLALLVLAAEASAQPPVSAPIRVASPLIGGLPTLQIDELAPNSRVIILGGGKDFLESAGAARRFTWPFEVVSNADGQVSYEPTAGLGSVPADENPLAQDSMWLVYEPSTDRWARRNRNFARFRNLNGQQLLGRYPSGVLEYNSLEAIFVFLRPNVGGWFLRADDDGENDLQASPNVGYSTIRPDLSALQPIGQTSDPFGALQNGDLVWLIDLTREGFVAMRAQNIPVRQ